MIVEEQIAFSLLHAFVSVNKVRGRNHLVSGRV